MASAKNYQKFQLLPKICEVLEFLVKVFNKTSTDLIRLSYTSSVLEREIASYKPLFKRIASLCQCKGDQFKNLSQSLIKFGEFHVRKNLCVKTLL